MKMLLKEIRIFGIISMATTVVLICTKSAPETSIKAKDIARNKMVFIPRPVPRSLHDEWTGVPRSRQTGTVFQYWSPHNVSIGKPLILADVYKERFDWPPREYVNLNESTDVSRGFVFVTGSSANHFNEGLDMISSVQQKAPGVKMVFWDLGLNNEALVKKIRSLCDVEYRKLNFSAYPVHVRYLKNYIVIADTIKDYPRVVWADASIRFQNTGNFSHIKSQMLQTDGILQMVNVSHTIYVATHKKLYEYFPTDIEKVKHTEMGGGGMITIYRTEHVFNNILLFWVLCALDVDCIQPIKTLKCNIWKRPYWGCHRFDQSTLAVLLANAYSYNFTLYRDFMATLPTNEKFVRVSRASYKNLPLKYCTG